MNESLNLLFRQTFKGLRFSPKQIDAAIWVLHGFSNEQISVLMRTHSDNIKQLLTAVYKKSKVKTRAQFIVFSYTFALTKQTPLPKGL
jgi:DNA-binding CsgD family transcriptional regulator